MFSKTEVRYKYRTHNLQLSERNVQVLFIWRTARKSSHRSKSFFLDLNLIQIIWDLISSKVNTNTKVTILSRFGHCSPPTARIAREKIVTRNHFSVNLCYLWGEKEPQLSNWFSLSSVHLLLCHLIPHSQKSEGVLSGDREGHSIAPHRQIQRPGTFVSSSPWERSEAWRRVILKQLTVSRLLLQSLIIYQPTIQNQSQLIN